MERRVSPPVHHNSISRPRRLYIMIPLFGVRMTSHIALSRRRFLQTMCLAAEATVALPALARAAEDDKTLPPAIAALNSLRAEAKPITVEERTQRQEKARQLMRENNLDAILLPQGTSLTYFTGIRWEGGERLFAMVLPAKGQAFYVAPAFEAGW